MDGWMDEGQNVVPALVSPTGELICGILHNIFKNLNGSAGDLE
jgi:hypothetical protein